MKKLFSVFFIVIFLSGNLVTGQSMYINGCIDEAMIQLRSCLNSQHIKFEESLSGNVWNVVVYSSSNRGQIQHCVAQYNSDRRSCPEAPTLVTSRN